MARIRVVLVLGLGTTLAWISGGAAVAQDRAADPDLAATEAFVAQSVQQFALPLDADQWLAPLRRYCFSAEADEFRRRLGRDPAKSLADGLWVLIRYEYTALVSTFSRSGALGSQAMAAWRLERAVQRFLDHTRESQLVNQPSWSLRMLRARSYLQAVQEMEELLPRRLEPRDVEEVIAAELVRILGPASDEEVNHDLQTAFRGAVKNAEETMLKATAARLQAIASLWEIYGADPEASRSRNQPRLAGAESQAFYDEERYRRVRALVQELHPGPEARDPSAPAANSELDLSILGRYAELRERLSLGDRLVSEVTAEGRPAPPVVEAVFGNDRREGMSGQVSSLARTHALMAEKLQVEVPDPIRAEDPLAGYRQATTELARRLTVLVAGSIEATATGDREQRELDRLRGIFPAAPEDRVPVPWFGTMARDDLRQLLAATDKYVGAQDLQRRMDEILRREAEGQEFSAALLQSLLDELKQQLEQQP